MRAISISKPKVQEADTILPPFLDPKHPDWKPDGLDCFLEGREPVEQRNILHMYKRTSAQELPGSFVFIKYVLQSRDFTFSVFQKLSKDLVLFLAQAIPQLIPTHGDFSLFKFLIVYV